MGIDKEDFLNFVRAQEGKELLTLTQSRGFKVRVTDAGVEYTPRSTMKPRPHQTKFMYRVLDIFDATGSYKTTDYSYFTVCSSYTLALIKYYLLERERRTKRED